MSCSRGTCGKDHGPLRDDEGPSEADIARFGDVTRSCPACKKEIYDDAELCYHCGAAIEGAARSSGGMPSWVIITSGVILAAFVMVLILR
ncbi:MAG: zinc ribbon domain-containing protein [Phycisphaerales bacterium]